MRALKSTLFARLCVKLTRLYFSRFWYSREHSGKWMHAEKNLMYGISGSENPKSLSPSPLSILSETVWSRTDVPLIHAAAQVDLLYNCLRRQIYNKLLYQFLLPKVNYLNIYKNTFQNPLKIQIWMVL